MKNVSIPGYPAMPDEFRCNEAKVLEDIKALDEAGEAALYYRSIEQKMRGLKGYLDSIATEEFKEALGEYMLRQDEEFCAANMDLLSWGRSVRQVLDRIHSTMDIWRDLLFNCLKKALRLLGRVMGSKNAKAGRDVFTAYYAALKEGSKFRKDRIDGLPLAFDECITEMPPFMSGFAQGYYGLKAETKKSVADVRKAYAKGMKHAYDVTIAVLSAGGMSDDVVLLVDKTAKKLGVRIQDLEIVFLGELEKLGVTMAPTDYQTRLELASKSNA